jgi:outer membrane protein assembly factor BamB
VVVAVLAFGAMAIGGWLLTTPTTDRAGVSPHAGTTPAAMVPSPGTPEPGGVSSAAPSTDAPPPPSPLGHGFLVADRGNGRILAVGIDGQTLWSFPGPGSLPPGQAFAADDAFVSPDHQTIVANDEAHQVVDRIDIRTRRVVWQYGHYGRAGSAAGYLHTPDDAYPLANGDIVVADIRNCRVLEIGPDHSTVRQWGRTGRCVAGVPSTYASPNGDTPLPDGGLLITEIGGSRVVRLAADGRVVFDIHVPVAYPSDAQLDANGDVVVADFSSPGQVVCVDPSGRLVWRYGPTSGPGRLDHPSLATPLPSGLVAVNDDARDRLVVIDPRTGTIVWQYGATGRAGSGPGLLSDPDGNQPLPAGLFGAP